MKTWPIKPGPLTEAGVLGQYGEQDSVPDCEMCKCYSRGCPGYKPLTPNATSPPCKTYTDYQEYERAMAMQSNWNITSSPLEDLQNAKGMIESQAKALKHIAHEAVQAAKAISSSRNNPTNFVHVKRLPENLQAQADIIASASKDELQQYKYKDLS